MGSTLLHRKDLLIISTIEVINDVGIQNLSTREIAKRQGVSEATLFRHYKSKNNLLDAVLDYFANFDNDLFETVVIKKLNAKDALTFVIKSYAEYYENYPPITSIFLSLEALRYVPELNEKVKQIYNNRIQFICNLVQEAIDAGIISHDIDSKILTDIIMGTFHEECRRWRTSGYNFSLKENIMLAIESIIGAFTIKR